MIQAHVSKAHTRGIVAEAHIHQCLVIQAHKYMHLFPRTINLTGEKILIPFSEEQKGKGGGSEKVKEDVFFETIQLMSYYYYYYLTRAGTRNKMIK